MSGMVMQNHPHKPHDWRSGKWLTCARCGMDYRSFLLNRQGCTRSQRMKKTTASAFLLLLLFASAAEAQYVKLPAEVKTDPGVFAVVRADTDCAELKWVVLDPGLSLLPPELLRDTKTVVVQSGRAGKYRLLAYGAIKDKASPPALCTVVVGDPVPPELVSVPDVVNSTEAQAVTVLRAWGLVGKWSGTHAATDTVASHAPAAGVKVPKGSEVTLVFSSTPPPATALRVLIVEDSADRTKLPAAQQMVLLGKPSRDYLDSVCAPDTQTASKRAWAIWDKDIDASGMGQEWREMLARPRGSVPWLVVRNPGTTTYLFEGPLPANTDALKAVLGKLVKSGTPHKLKKAA